MNYVYDALRFDVNNDYISLNVINYKVITINVTMATRPRPFAIIYLLELSTTFNKLNFKISRHYLEYFQSYEILYNVSKWDTNRCHPNHYCLC